MHTCTHLPAYATWPHAASQTAYERNIWTSEYEHTRTYLRTLDSIDTMSLFVSTFILTLFVSTLILSLVVSTFILSFGCQHFQRSTYSIEISSALKSTNSRSCNVNHTLPGPITKSQMHVRHTNVSNPGTQSGCVSKRARLRSNYPTHLWYTSSRVWTYRICDLKDCCLVGRWLQSAHVCWYYRVGKFIESILLTCLPVWVDLQTECSREGLP